MHKRMRRLAGVVFCALPGMTLAGALVNLLPHGDFSTANQLNGWQFAGQGTTAWNADDAAVSASSGSMQLDTDAAGNPMDMQSSCFAVTPAAAYSYGLEGKVIAGANPAGNFSCAAYAAANCGSLIYSLAPYPSGSFATSWTAWGLASGTLPANAQSVGCALHLDTTSSGVASVRFDNLFFNSLAPTTPVSLQRFEVD